MTQMHANNLYWDPSFVPAKIPRTITSDQYPEFIRANDALKKFSKQEKIFPKIGLKNSSEAISGTVIDRGWDFKNARIVFSGNGNKCLWDLATMSMRGIESCQKWTSSYAHCLAGSMIDPYAGIIYITDDDNYEHGTRMIKRSVVRFVVNKKNKKPAILIERVYPHNYDTGVADANTFNLFKSFIKKKINNKFPIIRSRSGHFIPITKAVNSLPKYDYSYRDSKIGYGSSPKYKDPSKLTFKD